MRLMVRDIELSHAEGEIDRVEVFERFWQVRKMQREKYGSENNGERLASSAFHLRDQAGRRNSPSFRLPVR